MHPYTAFLCTTFQGNRITHFNFMVTFTLCQKEGEKKKLSQFLKVYISETPGMILECGVLTVKGISTAKIIQFRTSSTKLRMHENCVIVLPVNILALASWATRHMYTTVCLDDGIKITFIVDIYYCNGRHLHHYREIQK